jgi:3-dehydroquinate dehydratase II
MSKPIYVLSGPNLNLLGAREPEIYGHQTLEDVQRLCEARASALGREIVFRQSNHEGELIDWIHALGPEVKAGRSIGAVYNPAAHSHYSYAIRDAIEGVELPVVEVHISNIHSREAFRQHSVVSPVAAGIVVGFGTLGYALAVRGLVELSKARSRAGAGG